MGVFHVEGSGGQKARSLPKKLVSLGSLRLLNALNSEDRGLKVRFL